MSSTFITKIDDKGQLDFGSEHNLARFHQYCLEHKGKILRIEPDINTRTLSQNKLYWLFLEKIEFETGSNSNDLHEFFKRTLLPPKFIKVLGREIKIPKSTTELKSNEFSDYMDKISAETGVEIPDSQKYLAEQDLAQTL